MRERIEDLGRLHVMIDNLLEDDIFDGEWKPYSLRTRDFSEWFEQQTPENREKIIDQFVYGIERVKDKIYKMWEVASGCDNFNEAPNQS
jgi:DNA-binding transcriptional regulator GbsR (MarR family)